MIELTNEELDKVGLALRLTNPTEIALAVSAANQILARYNTDWMGYWTSMQNQLKRGLVALLTNPPVELMLKRVLDSLPTNHKSRGMYEGYRDYYDKHSCLSDKQMPSLEKAYYALVRRGKGQ